MAKRESDMSWCLKRTKQCEKCPWRKDIDPHDIPNGYTEAKHADLESTIAKDLSFEQGEIHAMACHETHDSYCIGWLINQLGTGNNIPMRIKMMDCVNAGNIQAVGLQHESFQNTLP